MTQTITRAEEQRPTFLQVFVNGERTKRISNVESHNFTNSKRPDSLHDWFVKSAYLSLLEVQVFSADPGLFRVSFKLNAPFAGSFILLRGLLEFSRPKSISISANAASNSFELTSRVGVAFMIEYLDVIVGMLAREIRFKSHLKSILRFERSVKEMQAELYKELGIPA